MANSKRLETILGHLKASSAGSSSSYATGTRVDVPSGRKYRYSLDQTAESVLSVEQRDFFEENGFLVVKALVSPQDLDTYRERFRKICTKEVHVRLHELEYMWLAISIALVLHWWGEQ